MGPSPRLKFWFLFNEKRELSGHLKGPPQDPSFPTPALLAPHLRASFRVPVLAKSAPHPLQPLSRLPKAILSPCFFPAQFGSLPPPGNQGPKSQVPGLPMICFVIWIKSLNCLVSNSVPEQNKAGLEKSVRALQVLGHICHRTPSALPFLGVLVRHPKGKGSSGLGGAILLGVIQEKRPE